MCKYVDRKGLAAMLGAKRSAGVAPEVNLRNPLHRGNEAHKRGNHPRFETQGRYHQQSKTGISLNFVFQIFFQKKGTHLFRCVTSRSEPFQMF